MKQTTIMTLFKSIFGIKIQQNDCIKILEAREFKGSISNKKAQLIDVRTANEFRSGHLKGAKNIDYFSGRFNIEFDKINKEKPIYIYCRSGNRSKHTAKKLSRMGFKEIYDLKGGILNYN